MTTATQGNYKQPVNIAAERAVLAGLCQCPEDVFVEVGEIANVDCFTTHDNQILYKVIMEILQTSAKVDIPTIIARATSNGHTDLVQDKVKLDYIRSLFSYNVTKDNVTSNAGVIRKLEIARAAQKISKEIYVELSKVSGSESFDEIISKIEQPVFDYTTSLSSGIDDKTIKLGDEVMEYIEHVSSAQAEIVGIPSPWPIYNEAIGGGRRRGGVYLFGARPKVGKSSFAINDGLHVAGLGVPVLYLDTEMSKEGQLPRILACLAKQEIGDIERGKFAKNDFIKSKVMEAGRKFSNIPFHYRRIAGKPFDEILSIIRRFVVQDVGTFDGRTRDCLIIYDYFKLMDTSALDKLQEHQAIGFQVQSLTDFCTRYDVPCAAYVQLNRDGISKDTSDVISQSDRLVWLCASLALIKRKTTEEIMSGGPENGNMKMIVTAEQRFGPGLDDGDWINFSFDKGKCSINELGTKNNTVVNSNSFDSVGTEDIDEMDNDDDGEFQCFGVDPN